MTTTLTLLRTSALRALIGICALLCGSGDSSAADDVSSLAKPYPLENCVVSNDRIDPQVTPVIYNGQEYRFCCRGCVKKFYRDPEKYAARLAASTNRANGGNGANAGGAGTGGK
jgi:YHS domain-containing protein